ncbi:MAG: arabinose isomerase [Candidatus Sumerlaeia bacterium]
MIIDRRKPLNARIGVLTVGHRTYWDQFPGLLDTLMGYVETFKKKLEAEKVEVIDFGMVDNHQTCAAALDEIQTSRIDLLFVDMATYATSSTWGLICREVRVPQVLVALQPRRAMDYENATIRMQLENDNICSLPEFAGVAARMGRPVPPMIIGTLEGDERADAEIRRWVRIARVLHDLKGARIGQMGHVLEAMLDMHTDPTALSAHFGLHVVQTEVEDVLKHYRKVSDKDRQAMGKRILNFFDTPEPGADETAVKLTQADLEQAAQTALALERFVDEKELDGLAYYYEGETGSEIRKMVSSFIVGNSLLTAGGFPMCGEMDLKTCIAMMIMDRLDIGGSFAEFHPVDFTEDFILVGHDGPHHLNIAQGKPVLRSLKLYHGKPGSGASVEFKIKEGPISMLGINQRFDGRFKFIIAEGESREGLIPATGNTNTRGFFPPDAVSFLKRWLAEAPTHHFALGIGHYAEDLRLLAETLGADWALTT